MVSILRITNGPAHPQHILTAGRGWEGMNNCVTNQHGKLSDVLFAICRIVVCCTCMTWKFYVLLLLVGMGTRMNIPNELITLCECARVGLIKQLVMSASQFLCLSF